MDNKLLRKDRCSVVKVQFKFLKKCPRIYASKNFRLGAVTISSKYAAYLNTETKEKHTHSIHKQDMQCPYNITLRSVRVTIVAVENSNYYIF